MFSHLLPAVFHSIKTQTKSFTSIKFMAANYPFEVTGLNECFLKSFPDLLLLWFTSQMFPCDKQRDMRYPSGKILAVLFLKEATIKHFLWKKDERSRLKPSMTVAQSPALNPHRSNTSSISSVKCTPMAYAEDIFLLCQLLEDGSFQLCSTPQAGRLVHQHPCIRDIVTDHQNGTFNPFHREYSTDNTYISCSVTFLER